MNNNKKYKVSWTKTSLTSFAKIYNIDHESVLKKSFSLLQDPYRQSKGVANFDGFKYNNHHWTQIGNVIIVYSINDKLNKVRIKACHTALNGFALKVYYGEFDPQTE